MKKLFKIIGALVATTTIAVHRALACATGEVETGLGCIPSSPEGLVAWFLTVATRIAGGICLILLTYGGIKFVTSKGDWEALDDAKATITQALSGLLLIIFSVLLLKVIGYDILGLPGWGAPGNQLQLPQ